MHNRGKTTKSLFTTIEQITHHAHYINKKRFDYTAIDNYFNILLFMKIVLII